MPAFSCQLHRSELRDRVDVVRDLLIATNPPVQATPDVGAEGRGLSIVLLFGAYERLMTSLVQSLLEYVATLRVGSRRLRPGLKVFALFDKVQGLTAAAGPSIWTNHGPAIITLLENGHCSDLRSDLFPKDGSYMRASQVSLVAKLFGMDDPGTILKEVWGRLDTLVVERNGIAHGRLTAGEVGRNYTPAEVHALAYLWCQRWTEFLDHVETKAASRSFFRV